MMSKGEVGWGVGSDVILKVGGIRSYFTSIMGGGGGGGGGVTSLTGLLCSSELPLQIIIGQSLTR